MHIESFNVREKLLFDLAGMDVLSGEYTGVASTCDFSCPDKPVNDKNVLRTKMSGTWKL